MYYTYQFDIAAIILTAALIFSSLTRRTYPSTACRVYRIMLWFNLIASSADLLSAFTISFPESFPTWLNYLTNIVYLGVHNLTSVLFLLYIVAVINGDRITKRQIRIATAVGIAEFGALISSPWTHWIFYIDPFGQYTRGTQIWAMYLIAIAVLVTATVLMMRNRKTLSVFQMITNSAFVIILLVTVAVQFFIEGLLLECFSSAVAFLMMNVALDNPAKYFYRDTSCFNQTAFDTTMQKKLDAKVAFELVAFTFDDLPVFRKKFGEQAFQNLLDVTIRRCHQSFIRSNVFVFSSGTFVIVCNPSEANSVTSVIDHIVAVPFTPAGTDRPVTMTAHMCLLSIPGPAQTVSDINLVLSDMLTHVYRVTGLHVIWDTSKLIEQKHHEDDVVHILHNAIQTEDFEVFYQPIFSPKYGAFVTAEALVRLRDKSLGVYPDEFIPIAEQNGMILDIGEIVMKKVCRFIHESHIERRGVCCVNVNLSMLQLVRFSAVQRLADIVDEYGISPSMIRLEITETAAMTEDAANIKQSVTFLKNRGFRFALDDYGSGYSNFTNLFRFEFDQIKFDKGILWGSMDNVHVARFLASSVEMAHGMGCSCVAEGVENEEMVKKLDALGVDLYQGYLYSKPVNGLDFLYYLEQHGQPERK